MPQQLVEVDSERRFSIAIVFVVADWTAEVKLVPGRVEWVRQPPVDEAVQ
jgi:hypothetical protein